MEALCKNVEHIKVIVAMQQSHAKIGGALETLNLKEVMEDAVRINRSGLDRRQIRLIRDYHPGIQVLVDRHKVLQILVNLLSNAQHALEQTPKAERRVTLSLFAPDAKRVCLRIRDNGIGIEPDNLNRIFTLGFTTRRDGHGFGLHNGANAAKEMGGSLCAQSDGLGQGATFTLELPATPSPATEFNPNGAHHSQAV